MILPKDFDWRYFATPKSQIFTWRMLFCWLVLCLHTTIWSVVSFDEFESVMSHSSDLIWLHHKSDMHLTVHIPLRQSVHLYIKYLANKAIKGRWNLFCFLQWGAYAYISSGFTHIILLGWLPRSCDTSSTVYTTTYSRYAKWLGWLN